jgi:dUTP pyrophosphatase
LTFIAIILAVVVLVLVIRGMWREWKRVYGSEFSFVKFKLLRPGAILPRRATTGSGAFDMFAAEDGHLEPGEKSFIHTGVAHDLPGLLYINAYTQEGASVFLPIKVQTVLFDRSGLGKKGIRLSFGCLIDNDYRGEIHLSIENQSGAPFDWKAGDRLVQMTYVPMYAGGAVETQTLTETDRGAGGFGSTGR